MEKFTKVQERQEASYFFPNHYLDLLDTLRKIQAIEYLSYLTIVKNKLKPFKGQAILDAGCGDGRFCFELRNENIKIVGVDFSGRAIAFAGAFSPGIKFIVSDLEKLDLKNKFDYVVLIETLEHIQKNKIGIILKNLRSALKRGGKLIITVPSTNIPLNPKHYQHFNKESLEKILDQYFEILSISGQFKIGNKKKIFSAFKKTCSLLYLIFKDKNRIVNKYYSFVKWFFCKYLEVCDVEKASRLIVVCEKKQIDGK